MEFKKYQHIEKLGNTDVKDIEYGMCYIFPKLDGTNASLWWNNGLQAGSRKRQLSTDADNAGFYKWASEQDNIRMFFQQHSDLRLYGEWLVPHTLKTYLDTAWRDFYVFDVENINEKLIPYEEYKELLNRYNINYIAPIAKIKNPTEETLYKALEKNQYLIKDNEGCGEGIVIKNYNYVNPYGHTVWAKIVMAEFKEKHVKVMGCPDLKEKRGIEERIVEDYVTGSLIEKEYAKILNESGWNQKSIPRLLQTVFYCLVKEEAWNFVKEYKNPTINFKRLMSLTILKIKETKPELF